MVDCLAQQCPSPISACQNSIHFQMTFCSCRFPQSPITILAPFLLCFLTILTYSSLLWPQLYLPYQQSANTLRVVIGPFSAFQAQIVCIQQALTPYFLSWRDWDLCAWLSFCRVCWAAPWNVFRNPEAKNISPKQPQWLPCREQDLADEAEGLCPPGGVPPSNLQMPFLEERSLFSPCKCLLGLVPHWQ